jgi:hypothetical protein
MNNRLDDAYNTNITAARTEHALGRVEERDDEAKTAVGVRANEHWTNQKGKYGGGVFEHRAGVSGENRGRVVGYL